MQETTPAVVLDDVTLDFGGVTALSNVSLTVTRGKIFGVMGPNGAGKSTLLNVISGVLTPTGGRVRVLGTDVTGWGAWRIARLGVARTFQTVRLVNNLTVRANVMLGQNRYAPHGFRTLFHLIANKRERALRADAEQILTELDVARYADRQAGTLPYATKRRVELARVYAAKPDLVLLDEPAAGMNEGEREQLVADVRRLRDLGKTVLIVEHDVALMMRVCEEIALLNYGSKIAQGSPEEIRRNRDFLEAYMGESHAEGTA